MAQKRQLTEEQKKVLVERLKKAREAKKAKEKGDKPPVPPTPTPETSPKEKKKGWIGHHTLDKEPTG